MAAPLSSKVAAQAANTKFVTGNLSSSGKFFFGSLCVGTFGLGVWQLDRLKEKLDKIDDREKQLQMKPILYNSSNYSNDVITNDDASKNTLMTNNPYRRRLLRGVFRHDKEVLIGPRGAPAGVQMPLSGLSAKQSKSKTSTAGGMQPGPQGYHILTPMELFYDNVNECKSSSNDVVWINRGWVPKSIVPGANQSHFRNSNTGQIDIIAKSKLDIELKKPSTWNRPTGLQEMTVIISKPEKPRFITPVHDYTKRPLQLFWIDGLALKAIAEITPADDSEEVEEVALLTQVLDNENDDTTASSTNASKGLLQYPLQPPVSSITEFKTTPSVHVGYATTWFGLSGAGLYMTKKLITKGRY